MITCEKFDVLNGEQIYKYTLSDKISVDVVTCGATLTSIRVPNSQGGQTDVLLGLTGSRDIVASQAYMGSVVGRCANRIAFGKFQLEGKSYQLACNNGKNHLHGGNAGFNQKVFSAVVGDSLLLHYHSADGEENYPCSMDFCVKYTVSGSALIIDYFAEADGTTLCNPTNHAYFNLDGHNAGDIFRNVVQIFAIKYLPIDENLIPTGEERPVIGGAFDFTQPKAIGADISSPDAQLALAGGYDHNFCLLGSHAARVYSEKTGIVMDCYTDSAGLQFYTGNFLNGERGKAVYKRNCGFCLETQFYPNAINNPNWAQPVIKKGEKFHSQTRYEFSLK